jgi:hypothetical protein
MPTHDEKQTQVQPSPGAAKATTAKTKGTVKAAKASVRGQDYAGGRATLSPNGASDPLGYRATEDPSRVPIEPNRKGPVDSPGWLNKEIEAQEDDDEMLSKIGGMKGDKERAGVSEDRWIFASGGERQLAGRDVEKGFGTDTNKAKARDSKSTMTVKHLHRDIAGKDADGTEHFTNDAMETYEGSYTRGDSGRKIGVGTTTSTAARSTRKGKVTEGGLTVVKHDVTETGASGYAQLGKDGTRTYGVEATAKRSALQAEHIRRIGEKGHATELSAKGEALSASATVGAGVGISPDKVKVTGAAKANATLVGGNLYVETEAFTWNMFGEECAARIFAGVDASILAEAQGNVELAIGKGDNLEAGVKVGGKAFAGARAGVEVGGKLRWIRKSDYSADVLRFAKSLPGKIDDRLADKVSPDTWKRISKLLFGTNPRADLLIGKAGVEGSAGIGGAASFAAGLDDDGMLNVSAELGGTIGLGGKGHTDLKLGVSNGARFVGLMAMRGQSWLLEKIGEAASWLEEATDHVRGEIDAYMEAKKAQGGVKGMLATAADFWGDRVFNLW